MLHFIAILSFSTFISIAAYMVQHSEIQINKNFPIFNEQSTTIENQFYKKYK